MDQYNSDHARQAIVTAIVERLFFFEQLPFHDVDPVWELGMPCLAQYVSNSASACRAHAAQRIIASQLRTRTRWAPQIQEVLRLLIPVLLPVPALSQETINATADMHVDPFSDDEVPELLAASDLSSGYVRKIMD
ncbi:hypothetical protein C8J56DRAFT_897721 [Mycena floridula]|nr:hypothetical protein C8J56DRAFT_897721 [Mycena floridula]